MKFYFKNNEISKEEAVRYYERHFENIGATIFEQDLARLQKYLEKGDSSWFWDLQFVKM